MALCGVKRGRFLGPNVYPEAPDGGWGWMVAIAFFVVEAFTYGTIKIFGIFLQDIMEEFGETNSRVSWIISICIFVMTFNGPLSSVLTSRCGFQPVVMIGGLLTATGTIATSFTSSINQIYITYGLVAGLGYSLTYLPTVTILSQYFTRRRSLVTAVASTGESLSMFALAPAFSALRDRIGWRHTMVVIGALQSTIIICGALLRPIIIKPKVSCETEAEGSSPKELEALGSPVNVEDIHPQDSTTSNAQNTSHNELRRTSVSTGDSGVQSVKEKYDSSQDEKTLLHKEAKKSAENGKAKTSPFESVEKRSEDAEKQIMQVEEIKSGDGKTSTTKSKLIDFSILRECSFILYSMFGLFATLCFFVPPLYIIDLSVSRGVERSHATYMLSIMAVTEIFGRFSIGWIMSREMFRKRKLLVLLVCVITMTVDVVGFTLVTEFYGLAVCCAFYGFFMGTVACTHIPMLAEDDVVGIERMSSAAGVYVFIQSFAGLSGPPLGGLLVDLTQNYGSAFYSGAAGLGISAVFLGLVPPAKKGYLCRRKVSKRSEDVHERKEDSEEKSAVNNSDKRPDRAQDSSEATEATRDVQEVIRFA
ncbi:monocarboxylate transporter 7-like [Trematomus bernacchii]|uniref:monocarboxylate transporter 7-like n=1 Tax=Trematomus bernacchii TaxID=40690 RepID=UPI00146D4528|nr:monocarboxylate transporter 7-like [Trematomus bernacchii]